ncbi:hypothetical protein EIN_274190 [Entamoeba invadens IP1]|uniref:Uncharacterized protein n=1 Tax=Entamoeba invadens IP1 TaxID=370355 RepID=A0A0A1U1G4_ENTIV|nr:hypothetical protein EIN_274190 [Entamoeba invadens IP1]ELP87852.1 hypothetical protein EIN_274190 [Entamoeba invadens IP1]|eukprot:XP_004254623.1 hypothetical protein EIN_274190 [Entamoeba invadens IP1]
MSKTPEKSSQFKRTRNWHSQQCCVLISLLNQYFDVTYLRPFKFSTKSVPFIWVQSLQNNTNKINTQKLTDERVNVLIEADRKNDIDDKTIKRRCESYRIMEHLHVLMDVLSTTRFDYQTTSDKHENIPDRRILKSVNVDGYVFSREKMEDVGNKINSILLERALFLDKSQATLLYKGDTELMCALLLNDS